MPLLRLLLALVLFVGSTDKLLAQDTTRTANLRSTPGDRVSRVELRDGTVLYGQILDITPTTVRLSSAVGIVTLMRANITSARLVDATGIHDGEVWPEDPSRTRLFFAPTARTMRAGETYFSDVYVFLPSGQVGLTDRITLGGGMSFVPTIGLDEQLFYLTPKVGVYSSENVHLAVGALVGGAKKAFDFGTAGIGYGVATFGGEDASFTAAAAFAFADGKTASSKILMLGGSTRVSRSLALVTENYIVSDHASSILTGGVRIMSEHIAVDVALGTQADPDHFGLYPYLAFIYRW